MQDPIKVQIDYFLRGHWAGAPIDDQTVSITTFGDFRTKRFDLRLEFLRANAIARPEDCFLIHEPLLLVDICTCLRADSKSHDFLKNISSLPRVVDSRVQISPLSRG